ncbi:beta-ketoacyl synthase N-terminal-like domain-containing protein [Kitasatospora cineracea]|uniref:Beta-ketoacyl synthase-like protein n=1 Tax=Kitasatospora cineracea TaxID=88074 RepID=A0A8G1X8J2_9ACTN|nr:beta-ketoacyl synthase N-terminal-like domain-containing protein [Kitasatospora cineracea]ROR37231.1 beta-ketoacyl synthase-like protein [Kitasatospora cineracea]
MNPLRTLATVHWPPGEPPPPLPGFSASTFNPLVAAVAERCLAAGYGEPGEPRRTGLLLASAGGDRATALAIDTGAAGRRMPPLLFFQSNPNAVLGHVAARWGLTGPVVAISPPEAAAPGEVPPDALELAALLLADGDADQVLVIAAEQAEPAGRPTEPSVRPAEPAAGEPGPACGTDRATAVLVTAP